MPTTARRYHRPPRPRYPSSFALEVRKRRDAGGWTQGQTAMEAGLDRWQVAHIEVFIYQPTAAEKKALLDALARLESGKPRVRSPRFKKKLSPRNTAPVPGTEVRGNVPTMITP